MTQTFHSSHHGRSPSFFRVCGRSGEPCPSSPSSSDCPVHDHHGTHTAREGFFGNGFSSNASRNDHHLASSSPLWGGSLHAKASRTRQPWPPWDLEYQSRLTSLEAEIHICKGACLFEGVLSQAPHARSGHVRYNGFVSTSEGKTIPDSPSSEDLESMSIARVEAVECCSPWEFLAQPVMASQFGIQPGTITLDHWVSLASHTVSAMESDVARVRPRGMDFYHVLDRLKKLQHDEIDGDPILREHFLYASLIEDLDKLDEYENNVDQEITALAHALNHPSWKDFSWLENQAIVTHYESQDPEKALFFFQQLLLGVELYLRLRMDLGGDYRKLEILSFLPLRTAWNVAMAQIWLSKLVIERCEDGDSELPFWVRILDTKPQKEKLISLAHAMKWPNTRGVEIALEGIGNEVMSARNTNAAVMSWLSGLVLPGASTSWLVMQSLIDCDGDAGKILLAAVDAKLPNFGFQYRGASYWYWESIVGKVLSAAKGVSQTAGWVGPCHQTVDLERIQPIFLRQPKPTHSPNSVMKRRKVKSMVMRSDPLGPVDESYPVDEYDLVLPTTSSRAIVDSIRIQNLAFRPCTPPPPPPPLLSASEEAPSVMTYDAAVIFAINGTSWPIRLRYDVSFISAAPCTLGPHVLFHDYRYLATRIDTLLHLQRWGPFDASKSHHPPPADPYNNQSFNSDTTTSSSSDKYQHVDDAEAVIVIEAFGIHDNHVLARSWCAHHGFSAVVAHATDTCTACAIRHAYALCLSVVILIDSKSLPCPPPFCKHRHQRSAL